MKKTFEEKMKRVEQIAEILENGQTDIDKSIELFSEGTALIKELTDILDSAQSKMEKIVSEEEENGN